MSDTWWHLVAIALALTGMGWLALAMDVHWAQAMHRPASAAVGTRRLLRALGASALAVSLLACLMADRPSMAVLAWVMQMAGGAVLVGMLLARRPRWLAILWPAGLTPD